MSPLPGLPWRISLPPHTGPLEHAGDDRQTLHTPKTAPAQSGGLLLHHGQDRCCGERN